MRLALMAWALVLGLWSPAASAFDDLQHRAFRVDDGAPGEVSSLAQAADGTLWIGTHAGLFRYDGVRFEEQFRDSLPSRSIEALLADPDGKLWIGYSFGGTSLYDGMHLINQEPGNLPPGSVAQLVHSGDDTLWSMTSAGLARLIGNRWQRVEGALGAPDEVPDSIFLDSNRLWVLMPSKAYEFDDTLNRFEERPHELGERLYFGIPSGSTWLPDFSDSCRHCPNQRMIESNGTVWMAGAHDLRRYRWTQRGDAHLPEEERFTEGSGLSGTPAAFLEDREHNVWIGTDHGLERFSRARLRSSEEAGQAVYPLLIPGTHDEVWVSGLGSPVVRLGTGGQTLPSLGVSITAATRSADGSVWLAGNNGVQQYKNGTVVQTLPNPVKIPPSRETIARPPFQALAVDEEGAVWLSVVRGGLFRWADGAWTRADQKYPLPRGPAIRLVADEQRGLWLAYPGNIVAVIHRGMTKLYTERDGLKVGNVLALYVTPDHTWIAGDRGLMLLKNGQFSTVMGFGSDGVGADFALTSGIAELPSHELWLNSARGLYRIPAAEVMKATSAQTAARRVEFELLDWLDGLSSPVALFRPGPSIVALPNGWVWASRLRGIWSVDSAHIPKNSVPPIPYVQTLMADGMRYRPTEVINILPYHHSVQIDYGAGSLSKPERVSFKYRLVGFDPRWQFAGARRQTFYTNLAPGNYRFEVIAANEDGVWSRQAATLNFHLTPALYQRTGFKLAMALVGLALIGLILRVRLVQIRRKDRQTFETRHAERERIARDIHDTLLQGMQALVLRLQMWEENVRVPENIRREIGSVAHFTRSILVEGRERILMLRRDPARSESLAESIRAVGDEITHGAATSFEVSLLGDARAWSPGATEQILDIVREAIRNAHSHSQSNHIFVEIEYRKRELAVTVRDDGCGFDVLREQRSDRSPHFGLKGMQERAKQLGGEVDILSARSQGTTVRLTIPDPGAFAMRWLRVVGSPRVWRE